MTSEQEKVKVICLSLRELALSAHYQKKLLYYAHLSDAAMMLEEAYGLSHARMPTADSGVEMQPLSRPED